MTIARFATALAVVWGDTREGIANMSHTKFTAFLSAWVILCFSGLAFAGSYLDRAALPVNEASHACNALRTRLSDKELSHMVHEISKARLGAASHMQVPKEIALAHPHLLMVLENYERASDAAEHGETQRFIVYLQKATEEERIMKAIIEQMGWALPKI
jgi:hypothetical protein